MKKERNMSFNDLMNTVRHLDNRIAKWMIRHFYILFFEIFLVFVFLLFFVNMLKVIDIYSIAIRGNLIDRLLAIQTAQTTLILLLLLLNSFWMLFMFNAIIRIRFSVRDLNYHLSRRKEAQNPR